MLFPFFFRRLLALLALPSLVEPNDRGDRANETNRAGVEAEDFKASGGDKHIKAVLGEAHNLVGLFAVKKKTERNTRKIFTK